eukprot:gene17978-20838_t
MISASPHAAIDWWLAVHADAANVTNCYSPPPSQEVEALLALYGSTSCAGWVPSWPVSNSTNCCDGSWSGVTCAEDTSGICHVDSLDLAGYRLTGTLPMALGNLSYLSSFAVSQNYLVGTIPPSICEWSQVSILEEFSYLDVDGNDFTGSLPAFPSSSMLEIVYASSNELTGTIPASILSIPTLVDLELSNNLLSGQLPSVMPCWKTLSVLTVDNNQLTGSVPATMNTASSIVYLDLSYNRIIGSLPTFDNASHSIAFLFLNYNTFWGSIPSVW